VFVSCSNLAGNTPRGVGIVQNLGICQKLDAEQSNPVLGVAWFTPNSCEGAGKGASDQLWILPASGGDQLFANGVQDNFRGGVQIEFLHDVGTVSFHRVHAEIQDLSDFLV
jgi:hypothetical protein